MIAEHYRLGGAWIAGSKVRGLSEDFPQAENEERIQTLLLRLSAAGSSRRSGVRQDICAL